MAEITTKGVVELPREIRDDQDARENYQSRSEPNLLLSLYKPTLDLSFVKTISKLLSSLIRPRTPQA
jgi:hypothetical protein